MAEVLHAKCRILGHSWDYTTVRIEGPYYIQGLRCLRCSTKRSMKIGKRDGRPRGNRYEYIPGYLIKGGLSSPERDRVRLREIRSHLSQDE